MKRFFLWWEHLTVPPLPAVAPPGRRERHRKARFVSRFILVILLLACPDLLFLLILGDLSAAAFTGGALLILACSLVCNRLDLLTVAGSGCVLCVLLSSTLPIVTAGTLDVPALLNLSFLAVAVVLAGALIRPVATFVVALITNGLIAGSLLLLPHVSALDPFFEDHGAGLLLPALIFQLLLAALSFFVIRDLLAAITRADRAEEIATLQEEITRHEQARAQEKQQLEVGIAQIAKVHAQIARGNLEARVSLHTNHVLWTIAVPLNNLLSRMQGLKQERDLLEHEVQTMRTVLSDRHTPPPRQPATPTT